MWILNGSQFLFSKSEEPGFYWKAYISAIIICYGQVLIFPVILYIYRFLKGKKLKVSYIILTFVLFCFVSMYLTLLLRVINYVILYSESEYDWFYFFSHPPLTKIFNSDSLSLYLFNLFILFMKEYYSLYKERELKASRLEVELIRAQLSALKIQIHPHFLFNTLHLIVSLIKQKNNDLALDMTVNLSKFLRFTLNHYNMDFITLAKEKEMINLYLEIQQIRFSDRLKVNYFINPEVNDVLVPNMIMQPLIENSIRHGISKKQESGNLDISIKKVKNRLQIIIQDDGPGIHEDLNILRKKGIGLDNTLSRLEKLYSNNFSFELTGSAGEGARVILEIPCQLNKDQTDDRC
jgi:two-component system, LytTR family, sensor kinase